MVGGGRELKDWESACEAMETLREAFDSHESLAESFSLPFPLLLSGKSEDLFGSEDGAKKTSPEESAADSPASSMR